LFIKNNANLNNHAGEWTSKKDKLAHTMLYNNLASPPKGLEERLYDEKKLPPDFTGYIINEDDITWYSEAIHHAKSLYVKRERMGMAFKC